jgi:hypothetical protein
MPHKHFADHARDRITAKWTRGGSFPATRPGKSVSRRGYPWNVSLSQVPAGIFLPAFSMPNGRPAIKLMHKALWGG